MGQPSRLDEFDMSLFAELKRRNVIRVAIAYLVLGWLLLQVTDVVVPILELPDWVAKFVLFLLLLGLPLVLFFAWAYELTPEGVKREKDVDRGRSIATQTGKKLDRAIIGILVITVALLLFDRFSGTGTRNPVLSSPQVQSTDAPDTESEPAARSMAKSIAVLPFNAMSSGPDDEYFADGLTEEILNSLAQLPELLVTARTSAFSFKGQDLPVQEIAQVLGVAHIVEGSVRKSGDRLRVTAQLIRAEDGFHLWSENYDSSEADTIAVQEDIAEKIAQALDVVLDDSKRDAMRRAGLRDVEAFVAYQKAMEWYARAHGEVEVIFGLSKANEWLDRVIERAPDFPVAYNERSDLYIHALQAYATGADLPGLESIDREVAMERAVQDLLTAVEKARSPEERRSFGLDYAYVSENWLGIPGRLEQMLADETCNGGAWLPPIAAVFGYASQALPRITRGRQCDPLASINWFTESRLLLWSGDPAAAAEIAREGMNRAPGNWLLSALYRARVAMGDFEAAEQVINTQLQNPQQIFNGRLLIAAVRSDEPELARLLEEGDKGGEDRAFWGLIHRAWAGQRDAANALASQVDQQPYGSQSLVLASYWCACGSPWDLDATPRFKARIEAAGLPWPPTSPIAFPLKDW
jgi:TolB-like protein